jgi:chromosome segregation ATPase
VAVALAAAVAVGASFSAVATGAFQDAMQVIGFGGTEALALEQRRQAATVVQVRQAVGELKGAVARLERSHPGLARELAGLQTRMEKSGQTDVAIINRIGTLAADFAVLRAEMRALQGATADVTTRTEAAVAERLAKVDADVSALRSEAAATDRFARIDSELALLRREISAVALDVNEGSGDAPWRAHVDDLNSGLARAGIELGALRSSLDARGAAQRAQLDAQRQDLSAIARRIDRLEHAAARDATGSVPAKPARKRDQRALSGWSVTANGDSVLITGAGGTFEAKAGTVVPGLGRVADVRQRGARWIVVTDKGVIAQR